MRICIIIIITSFISFVYTIPLANTTTWRGSKVLNFISLPDPQECVSTDNRKTGVCQNPYECRMLNGEAKGQCALGFGVCCVYTVSCGGEINNNVGYFVSPGFPDALVPGSRDLTDECRLKVVKSAPEISQIRLDMVHFTLGQPNRKTGVCEQDLFTLKSAGNSRTLRMCGQNTGHHFYFDLGGDDDDSAEIIIKLAGDHVSRFWEMKITQVEFKDRAPAGCLQYYKQEKGVIQTMNFAENGRHLANQDYNICIHQEDGMCSIVYEPCDENSFRIGPAFSNSPIAGGGGGGGGSTGTQVINPNGQRPLPPGEADVVPLDETLEGSGGGGFDIFNLFGDGRESKQILITRECDDRIVMPCDSEDFIPVDQRAPGICDLLHCGNSFCSNEDTESTTPGKCKIESSTLPFNIAVHFGPGLREENPEDNLGMCLRYAQQPC